MEFNEYLELGNKLEQENKIIMACAAYLEAIKNGTEEQSEMVKKYAKMLAKNISEDYSERNHQVQQQLLEWKEQGKLLYAKRMWSLTL